MQQETHQQQQQQRSPPEVVNKSLLLHMKQEEQQQQRVKQEPQENLDHEQRQEPNVHYQVHIKPEPRRRGRPPKGEGAVFSQRYLRLKKYRAQKKDSMDDMAAQVEAQLAQVRLLEGENEMLQAHERLLHRAIACSSQEVVQLQQQQQQQGSEGPWTPCGTWDVCGVGGSEMQCGSGRRLSGGFDDGDAAASSSSFSGGGGGGGSSASSGGGGGGSGGSGGEGAGAGDGAVYRWTQKYARFVDGVRVQQALPEGTVALDAMGTPAPGLVEQLLAESAVLPAMEVMKLSSLNLATMQLQARPLGLNIELAKKLLPTPDQLRSMNAAYEEMAPELSALEKRSEEVRAELLEVGARTPAEAALSGLLARDEGELRALGGGGEGGALGNARGLTSERYEELAEALVNLTRRKYELWMLLHCVLGRLLGEEGALQMALLAWPFLPDYFAIWSAYRREVAGLDF